MSKDWVIRGYDSTDLIYERRVGLGQFTEKQMRALLKTLTAKAGLSEDEIVGAYATRRTKIANDLLDVQRSNTPKFMFQCGSNPYFIAFVDDPK